MGLFADFTFRGGEWQDGSSDGSSGPSLTLSIHDSDIASVSFSPAGDAKGLFFLGCEPRIYFNDDGANAPVDRSQEAAAFSVWVLDVMGRDVDPQRIEDLLPQDVDDDPLDVFVEDTVRRLLALAGLPMPVGLSS